MICDQAIDQLAAHGGADRFHFALAASDANRAPHPAKLLQIHPDYPLIQSGFDWLPVLRFFDQSGRLVKTSLDLRVVSMRLEQLKKVDRSIGVAGGKRKHAAIQAAAKGGWINILVTDQATAEYLLR